MKLEHANITVSSIAKTREFLQLVFSDFRVRGGGRTEGATGTHRTWEHIGNDDYYIALEQLDSPEVAERIRYQGNGVNHLAFVIEEMDDLLARLKLQGYEPTDASALEGHPFRRRAYFIDGNDLEWEFVEYLSDQTAERNSYTSQAPDNRKV
ncbi:MAG: VOC family protein [Pseudomonadales bacterium]|nr:VOC family protein [Pseudomonadales bacterium]